MYFYYYCSGIHVRQTNIPYRTASANHMERGEMTGDIPFAGSRTVENVMSNRSPYASPHILSLCVSDQCDFACKMCTYRPGRLKEVMTLDDWKKLIDETLPSDVEYSLFGGEPLLYKEIDELVSYMGRSNAKINIVTNGYFLEEHVDILMENNCNIIISIDGLGHFHDAVRGREGSFAKIEKALARIMRTYPDEKIEKINVNSVLLPENAEHVGELIDYLYGIGVTNITFQHLQFFGEREQKETDHIWREFCGKPFDTLLTPRKKYDFTHKDINKIRKAIKEIQKCHIRYPDMSIYIFPGLSIDEIVLYYSENHGKLMNKSLCMHPWSGATISVDGSISLCLGALIGNYKQQNFWSAWYGQEAVKFREQVISNFFPVCTRCCNFYNTYIPD